MSARTMNWDAVAASAPLDKQASVIRDGSGETWTPRQPIPRLHFDDLPPMKPVPAGAPQLVGRKSGRLTVMGLYDFQDPTRSKKAMASWVVRCVCGRYETRKAKSITNRVCDEEDACWVCHQVEHMREGHKATRVSREADSALLDRLANPTTCRDCKTPATCAAFEQCVLYQAVAA